MSQLTPSCSPVPGKRSELVERTLQVTQSTKAARDHLIWSSLNAIVLSFIFYYLSKSTVSKTGLTINFVLQVILATLFFINTVYHFYSYLRKSLCLPVIAVSPTQKKLMGIHNSVNFKESSKKIISPDVSACNNSSEFTSTTPMNLSASSWFSQSILNTTTNSLSPNYSVSSPSWIYQSYSPQVRSAADMSSDEFITDNHTLNRFLNNVEELEKKSAVSDDYEQQSSMISSFWNHNSTKNNKEASPSLRRCVYQVAPPAPATPATSTSPGCQSDESISPVSLQYHQDIWRKFKVDPSALTQWNANLRMWISLTILQRLVKEFQVVDDLFQRSGFSDMMIGSVGLERLKKTAQNQQVVASIPSLPRLVSYLDISPHQEYVVARIKELSKGGGMSEYRWNSGGSLNGKDWEEHLPTDATLVMHLIATYLDTQLLPMLHHQDGRPFSSQYLVKNPEKPLTGRNGIILYQPQFNPPHFVLLDNDHCLEVAKGRNNLFHTFLLFLHLLKTKEHEMLGRVNLGPSGVNILWVIES